MYEIKITNLTNNSVLTFNNPASPFIITEILGLSGPQVNINMDESAVIDGAFYNSSKARLRELQIAFAIDYKAAANRQIVYKVLQAGKKIRVDYKDQEGLEVYVEGYCGQVDIPHFAKKQICTVPISCPDAYWTAMESIVNGFVYSISSFHFPFYSESTPEIIFGEEVHGNEIVIDNEGSVDIGFIATIKVVDSSVLAAAFVIRNLDTGEEMSIMGAVPGLMVDDGDIITINTIPNQRSVTLKRGNTTYNALILTGIGDSDEWIRLIPGENTLHTYISGSSDALEISITHAPLYEGV